MSAVVLGDVAAPIERTGEIGLPLHATSGSERERQVTGKQFKRGLDIAHFYFNFHVHNAEINECI